MNTNNMIKIKNGQTKLLIPFLIIGATNLLTNNAYADINSGFRTMSDTIQSWAVVIGAAAIGFFAIMSKIDPQKNMPKLGNVIFCTVIAASGPSLVKLIYNAFA
jgi:hypothetical protein